MPGCFGLLDAPHHQGLVPAGSLVEHNPVLDVFELARRYRIQGWNQIDIEMLANGGYHPGLHAAGKSQTIRIGWHDNPGIVAARIAFICPDCDRKCYRLHQVDGVWACRQCHRLDYACRHRHRTTPGYSRAIYLRRRIGASPELFTPIPPRPRNHRRYWRLVRELRAIEEGIARYLGGNINDVLERRDARQRRNDRHDPA
jgi:ribosomal protein L37AE/L43A